MPASAAVGHISRRSPSAFQATGAIVKTVTTRILHPMRRSGVPAPGSWFSSHATWTIEMPPRTMGGSNPTRRNPAKPMAMSTITRAAAKGPDGSGMGSWITSWDSSTKGMAIAVTASATA